MSARISLRWGLLGIVLTGAILGILGRYYLLHPERAEYLLCQKRIQEGGHFRYELSICWKRMPMQRPTMHYATVAAAAVEGTPYGSFGSPNGPWGRPSPEIVANYHFMPGHALGVFETQVVYEGKLVPLRENPTENVFFMGHIPPRLERVSGVQKKHLVVPDDWPSIENSALWKEVLLPMCKAEQSKAPAVSVTGR